MIIDLSVSLNNDTPAYPGDPRVRITTDGNYADDGYLGHEVALGTHSGTHIDAPAHMIDGAVTLGQIPLDTFAGAGKLVDGFSIEALKAAAVGAGDIVLFDTGTGSHFHNQSYFTHYPVMPEEIANYLIMSRVKLVGLDTCSADNTEGFPIHKQLLGAGIPIIENLTNLAALHDKTFMIYALPLKLDLDGAPARVIAVTNDA